MSTMVEIEKITVSEDRHRKIFKKIDELAASILEFGLIEPIIIDDNFNLIAGERRLKACKQLGMKEVECEFKRDLDDWHKKAVELEENIRREALTYAEEVEAKLQLHELYQKKYGTTERRVAGGWKITDTADLVGESEGKTTMDLQLARAIRRDPSLAEKTGKIAAFKDMKAQEDIEFRKEIAKVIAEEEARKLERIRVLLGNPIEEIKKMEEESVDLSIFFYTYSLGKYYEWDETIKEIYRVLKKRGHFYIFARPSNTYMEIGADLTAVGFTVAYIPLIWVREPSHNPDFYTRYTSSYTPIIFCAKGTPRPFGITDREDVFVGEMKDVIEVLIRVGTVEDEIVLCPEGGAIIGKVCKEIDRRFVGIEVDENYYVEAWKTIKGEESGLGEETDTDSISEEDNTLSSEE